MEKHKFGFIELRFQRLNEKFARVEIDFKGRLIWSTCRLGEERETIIELLRELFEDEFESLLKICEKYKIDLMTFFAKEEKVEEGSPS